MFKTEEKRLKAYRKGYKKLVIMMNVSHRLLVPTQRGAEQIEHCLYEIIGMEAVLGVSPKERIAVMDEILGPDLTEEVIPMLKGCMFLSL